MGQSSGCLVNNDCCIKEEGTLVLPCGDESIHEANRDHPSSNSREAPGPPSIQLDKAPLGLRAMQSISENGDTEVKPPPYEGSGLPLVLDAGLEQDLVALRVLKVQSHGSKGSKEGRTGTTTEGSSRAYRIQKGSLSSTLKGKLKSFTSFASTPGENAVNASSVNRSQFWNANLPQDFLWLEVPLRRIAQNASFIDVRNLATGEAFEPLFFVLGACPNTFCGMQAVMYSAGASGALDFWWVKPAKNDSTKLESNTLCRHGKGPHKNDPGRSKPFYQPIADLFTDKATNVGGLNFGVAQVDTPAGKRPRAFVERASAGDGFKLWLTMVWQEEWTTNPFSRSKYIKGKLVYQKDPEDDMFYSRPYSILNGAMAISDAEDEPFMSAIPGIEIKFLEEAPS
mmetsp:Transcript_86918/g.156567  ORF Transcript_86918/g.156567 Transcript_86918/m.156567 type:complete len:397 (-) Transcript_86918:73-1263(-)